MAASSLFSARPKKLTTLLPLSAPDVTNGLIAWYNGFGNSARDISGNNNNGSPTYVTYAASPFGNAFSFNGSAAITLPSAG